MAYRNRHLHLLLTDASGLTSRQVATQAAASGHRVEALSPTRLCLGAFTRHVRRIHLVPAFGGDPDAWLEATIEVLRTGLHDVLLATQEQVAILAREAARVSELGVGLVVPPFASVLRVQDKAAQVETLRELGLPHPPTQVAHSPEELRGTIELPAYLKAPVGTASNAVRLVRDHDELTVASSEFDFAQGVVAQQAISGPLVMIQAVFGHGQLVAWHANLREREGSSGGASVKRSVELPAAAGHLRAIGGALNWHGALSLDAILTPHGPSYIDINPRLVEPGNAWRAGTDLVAAMVDLSLGMPPMPALPSRPNVRTHQLLLAILGAAQTGQARADVARELAQALAGRGPYAESTEELTPLAGDPLAAAPVAVAALATLLRPAAWSWFAGGAVSAYALTTNAWTQITEGSPPHALAPGELSVGG